jgi:hypothetical protein
MDSSFLYKHTHANCNLWSIGALNRGELIRDVFLNRRGLDGFPFLVCWYGKRGSDRALLGSKSATAHLIDALFIVFPGFVMARRIL